jgi:hypothetical protein
VSSQNYWNVIYRYVAMAVFGLALIGVVCAFVPKMAQFRSYQGTKNTLETDLRAQEEAIKELRLKQERFSTDKYFVQQIAHEIGFAHEGETIYQFSDKEAVSNNVQTHSPTTPNRP